jgi:hypothetical protein
MIASQSHDIALSTDEIAKLIVQDANQKEFEGKNEVKAKYRYFRTKKIRSTNFKRKR